jgi:hypothetical protein
VGQPVTLTATLSPYSTTDASSDGGTVTFTNGSTTLGTGTLSSGVATLTTSALQAGTDPIQANFAGNNVFEAATATTSVMIEPPVPPGITVSGTAVNVAPGATSGNASTVTVTPTGGFIGSVTVTLTAAVTSSPAGAAYPPSVSFGSTGTVNITSATAGTATLTISTTAPTNAALARSTRRGVPWFAAGGAALACLLFFGIPGRRRSWRTMFGMLALLATLAGGVASCGGSAASNVGSGGVAGTTAGTYTVTVTAVSTTTSATGLVTLTVQ